MVLFFTGLGLQVLRVVFGTDTTPARWVDVLSCLLVTVAGAITWYGLSTGIFEPRRLLERALTGSIIVTGVFGIRGFVLGCKELVRLFERL